MEYEIEYFCQKVIKRTLPEKFIVRLYDYNIIMLRINQNVYNT